ncbi:MAG TPA: hypothetical protein VEP50_11520 [bacterium]|nr:hypothetical protein [bacterium]
MREFIRNQLPVILKFLGIAVLVIAAYAWTMEHASWMINIATGIVLVLFCLLAAIPWGRQ